MSPEQTFEVIPADTLLERVRAFREQGWRLVQIGATRLPDQLELTYSFDRESRLANLRVALPGDEHKVPSISSIFWCAFVYENELHDLFGLQVSGMAVDFQGNFYKTAVKFPFGATKPVVDKPAAAPAPAAPQPPSTTT